MKIISFTFLGEIIDTHLQSPAATPSSGGAALSARQENDVRDKNSSRNLDAARSINGEAVERQPPWFLPGFFEGVGNDVVVDTTLRLRPPGSPPPPEFSRGGAALSASQENDVPGKNSSGNLNAERIINGEAVEKQSQWFLPGFFDGVENDVVDTTLRLRPPSSRPPPPAPESNGAVDFPAGQISLDSALNLQAVSNPTPLRCFPPKYNGGVVASPAKNTWLNPAKKCGNLNERENKKRRHAEGGDDRKKKKKKIVDRRVPIGFKGLLRAVKNRGGSMLQLLYKKQLESRDLQRDLHTVYLEGGNKVADFLKEDEYSTEIGDEVTSTVGVDGGGRVYSRIVCYMSPAGIVIRSEDWNDMVKANGVMVNDVIEIWGYDENDKSCLAFYFTREREEEDKREKDKKDGEGGATDN